jgi:putative ABC transport system permease protein
MLRIAFELLVADRGKYLGLVLAVAFAAMLVAHQVSMFVGILRRTTSQILDVRDAPLWVSHPRVAYYDEVEPLPLEADERVRSVPGVAWAVPFVKGTARVRSAQGFQLAFVLGVDDATLAGAPRDLLLGTPSALRATDAVLLDDVGFAQLFPGTPLRLGDELTVDGHRARVVGIHRATPPFQTLPAVCARASVLASWLGAGRKPVSFVLAEAAPGCDPRAAIEQATGLRARTGAELAWDTQRYYLEHTGIAPNFAITVALALVVGTAIAGQTFYVFALEHERTFATLKAIGVTDGTLGLMVVAQAAWVAVLGCALGIGAAASFFEATKESVLLRGFFLPAEVAVGTAVVVTSAVLLASLASLRRVRAVEPALVFRG